jgi:hypothetical protein
VWDLLPASLACNFIAYVQSTDILVSDTRSREGITTVLNEDVFQSLAPHRDIPIWQPPRADHDNQKFETARASSPPRPSVASTRSKSPTIGTMSLSADGSSHFQSGLFSLTTSEKLSTSTLKPNLALKSLEVLEAKSSQEKSQSLGLQERNPLGPTIPGPIILPPVKKSRTNTPWTQEEEQLLILMRAY